MNNNRRNSSQSSSVKQQLRKKTDHTFTIMNRREAPYMDYIRKGIKRAEGRIYSPAFQRLQEGQTIWFHNRHEGTVCTISYIHTYRSFEEMLTTEGVNAMLPQLGDQGLSEEAMLAKGIAIYERFPNAQRVHSKGCVAIGVRYMHEKAPKTW